MTTHRRAITTNMKFTYADQAGKLHRLAKYFQYRNDKEGASHVQQRDERGKSIPRWVDQGLGDNHRAILNNCLDRSTQDLRRNVGSRLMVIGPEVNLMHAIEPDRRADVLRELTEATIDGWFERMDLPTPPYAYVVHESQPADTRPDGQLKDDGNTQSYLHTHVILAPTVPGLEGEHETYKVFREQLTMLHEAGREAMEQIWERELGVERYAELQTELEERDRYQRELDARHLQQELEALEPELAVDTPTLERDLDWDMGMEMD